MLIWLSGIDNTKYSPNENYGRELMELFTLGASDEGYPYSEDDVREQARALTGWTASWRDDIGYVNFRFERPPRHRLEDDLRPDGRLRLAGLLPAVPRATRRTPPTSSSGCGRTSSPGAPDAATQQALEELYLERLRRSGRVVEAILTAPAFHEGPAW